VFARRDTRRGLPQIPPYSAIDVAHDKLVTTSEKLHSPELAFSQLAPRGGGSLEESIVVNEAMAADTVRNVILSTWPRRFTREQLGDDQALGAEGLGLDSVEVAELIIACEQACGRSDTGELMTSARLTIGSVIADLG
jgi:acyl carrier protein